MSTIIKRGHLNVRGKLKSSLNIFCLLRVVVCGITASLQSTLQYVLYAELSTIQPGSHLIDFILDCVSYPLGNVALARLVFYIF